MGNVKLTFVYFNVAMLAHLNSLAARLRFKKMVERQRNRMDFLTKL